MMIDKDKDKDITPTSYCREADVFSYPLIDALSGASLLFTLGGILFNLKQLKIKGLYEHSIAFPSFTLGRAVFTQNINNKLENYSLLSIKPRRLLKRVVSRIPLSIWIFFVEETKKAAARALRNVRTILARQSLDSLRPEMPLVETARSAGQTLNSALNFPMWKLGKVFHGLIRRDINTDSLHIISHNLGSVYRSLPFFQFLIYK